MYRNGEEYKDYYPKTIKSKVAVPTTTTITTTITGTTDLRLGKEINSKYCRGTENAKCYTSPGAIYIKMEKFEFDKMTEAEKEQMLEDLIAEILELNDHLVRTDIGKLC